MDVGEEASGDGSEPDGPSEIEDPLEKMEAEIMKLEKELQYSAAEIVNIRQRSARDKSDAVRFGASSLSRKILPRIGSLEKAVSNFEESSSDAFLDGTRMTLDGIWTALQTRRGLAEPHNPRPVAQLRQWEVPSVLRQAQVRPGQGGGPAGSPECRMA